VALLENVERPELAGQGPISRGRSRLTERRDRRRSGSLNRGVMRVVAPVAETSMMSGQPPDTRRAKIAP
jgi:hypothetical protein